ncbi:enoyl-CoA hydratase/isomerase family protein [Flexibacterium corallicola]|uniref:enoyl-CoA hydratase/isomerase family protein n=1 Tax=Flexibacterium corallicola TaxID=3037259 RepID=UPI00286EC183|nr:enoyl-CoA hydratase/isomerase family protein [Pseudovibrio sp. M1P-2-3]
MNEAVVFEKTGYAGIITLNRVKALNALTQEMVQEIQQCLLRWEHDGDVHHVIIKSASEKAFCAGGDIRKIYDIGRENSKDALSFFADEYRLNAYMKAYPKPLIALIDGIVMGGGVGISVHGGYRVGTERTLFSMPETGIGFFPDVGGGYFLPRMPHNIGMYCALTAERLRQADCYWTGILTHTVHSDDISQIIKALGEAHDVDAVLSRFTYDPGPAPLAAQADLIEKCFQAETPKEIFKFLENASNDEGNDFAGKALAQLRRRSPSSIAITHEQLKRGAELDMPANMRMEFRIVANILKGNDFYEGVRAVLVDKDNTPQWQPSSLSDIEAINLQQYFAEPDGGDLNLAILNIVS